MPEPTYNKSSESSRRLRQAEAQEGRRRLVRYSFSGTKSEIERQLQEFCDCIANERVPKAKPKRRR